ncbi:MAG: hypothetical protein V1915_00625 [Candidatus Bathyarchaeota archaeon]
MGESLGWDEVCAKAATLLDTNSETFLKLVDQKAQSIYKSRFLRELNKARATVATYSKRHGYLEGLEGANNIERFKVPCSQCGSLLEFRNTHDNW